MYVMTSVFSSSWRQSFLTNIFPNVVLLTEHIRVYVCVCMFFVHWNKTSPNSQHFVNLPRFMYEAKEKKINVEILLFWKVVVMRLKKENSLSSLALLLLILFLMPYVGDNFFFFLRRQTENPLESFVFILSFVRQNETEGKRKQHVSEQWTSCRSRVR